jgi:hypothetical protein
MTAAPATTGLETIDGKRVYSPDGEVLRQYLKDRSHVSIIRGPIGSGTSSASCMKIYMLAMEQKPSPIDGKRRSRWAIVRNTYPDLTNTTLKTWLDWFPEAQYGTLVRTRPMCHMVRIGDIELDVYFLALDSADDISKLRSLELTGVWFNELEWTNKAIFDEAESRTGRYPSMKEGGSNWDGVIADLNAPNEDHWLPQMTGEAPPADDLTEEELGLLRLPTNWSYFIQPPALLEIRSPDGRQVVGYKMNPACENQRWLKPGYYEEKSRGKKKAWIDSRLRNQIVFVVDGEPVWGSFNQDTHIAAAPLLPVEGHEVIIGMDFGRRPCALFMQHINNRIFIQYEVRGYGMGAATFAPIFKRFLAEKYPGFEYRIYGDPKGQDKGQGDERTAYEIFATHGITVLPAPGLANNNIQTRLAAVESALNEMHNGLPRVNVSPSGCPTFKAAMCGRYHVRKGANGDPDPVKDKFSDVADCAQYAFLGLGEGRRATGRAPLGSMKRLNVAPKAKSLRRVS